MLTALFLPLLLGAACAIVAGLGIIPAVRKLKASQVISSDAPERHRSKGGTPTMGGLILLAGLLLVVPFYPASGSRERLAAVVLCTLGFAAVGFLDDLLIIRRGRSLGLRAREKLAGQAIVALLFVAWHHWSDPASSGAALLDPQRLAGAAVQVVLLVGMSNAVNLTDGLDGLAGGVTLPIWMTLAAVAAFLPARQPGVSDYGLVVFCAAFAGATLGYLWYNAHPAQIFMGDTGSLAIGGGLMAAAIALRQEALLLLAAAVPLAEMLSVIVQVISFQTTRRRIFRMSPLHHHFELCDWPETRIVARFSIASALCGLLALTIVFAR